MELLEKHLAREIMAAVVDGDGMRARTLTGEGLSHGVQPTQILNWLIDGIRDVGRRWEAGEYFLPELVSGAEAIITALAVLKPVLADSPDARRGCIAVIGTVAGDTHDIGKSLVGTMWMARGIDVVDLGTDVSAEGFADAVGQHRASLVGLSALLTTTMLQQKTVVDMLSRRGLRDSVKVLVGGAPVTPAWAEQIGADGTAQDAMGAADLAAQLLGLP